MPIYIAMFTGSIVLIGAMLILMFRKAYVDPVTKEPTEFELPILGKIKTQSPLIVIALIGAALLFMGLSKAQQDTITVTGQVESDKPVTIYFVGYPSFQLGRETSGKFSTVIPLIPNLKYHAKYVIDRKVVEDKELDISGKEVDLMVFTAPAEHKESAGEAPPVEHKIEASNEQVKQFLSSK